MSYPYEIETAITSRAAAFGYLSSVIRARRLAKESKSIFRSDVVTRAEILLSDCFPLPVLMNQFVPTVAVAY